MIRIYMVYIAQPCYNFDIGYGPVKGGFTKETMGYSYKANLDH